MLSIFKRWFKAKVVPSKPITIFQQAIDELNLINPYALRRIYSSDLSIFILNVPVNRVLKYKHLLEKSIEGMKTDSGLFKHDYEFEFSSIAIDKFFLTNNGYYLDDVLATVTEFLDVIRQFLILYRDLYDNVHCSPVGDHNRRVLAKLASNVIDIVHELNKVQ